VNVESVTNEIPWNDPLCKFYRVTTYVENLEKLGNLTVVGEKSGKVEKIRFKSGKLWFACGVLPQLL